MLQERNPGQPEAEHFVLRVLDNPTADKIRQALQLENPNINLRLEVGTAAGVEGKTGTLTIGNTIFPTKVLSFPTHIEAYKTLDDINLVKSADVSEVILVLPPDQQFPTGGESLDGLTPPFRNARHRHFKQLPQVDPELVRTVESDLLSILDGKVPKQWNIQDVEEEWRVDPRTGRGRWVAVQPEQASIVPLQVQQKWFAQQETNNPQPQPPPLPLQATQPQPQSQATPPLQNPLPPQPPPASNPAQQPTQAKAEPNTDPEIKTQKLASEAAQ